MTARPCIAHRAVRAVALVVAAMMSGCATPPSFDYTAFRAARPATLLVLPPLNESPDVKATAAVWSAAVRPLAEAGYYVLPITLVDTTFRENGLSLATDIHEVAPDKLRQVFGADAAVYLRISQYGTRYAVLVSETRVEVEARIVDLRSGAALWQGKAVASSGESQGGQGGLAALMVQALVHQVIGTTTDAAYGYAGIAGERLFSTRARNGLLPGPRAPAAGQAR